MASTLMENLKFSYLAGGITPVKQNHSTERRVLPCWAIVAPRSGGVGVEVCGDGTMYCKAGEAVVIKPNVQHRFFCENSSGFVSLWSHVNFSLPGNISVADVLDCPIVVKSPAGAAIAEINEEFVSLAQQGKSLKSQSRMLELGFSLLHIICSVSHERERLSLFQEQLRRIQGLMEFIDINLDKPLGRDDLAEFCGLSPARFHVVFRQCTGMAPMAFVKRQRMEKAKILLARTDMSVSEIGRAVGYEDQYIFSRAFKNTETLSPVHYRKQAMAGHFFR